MKVGTTGMNLLILETNKEMYYNKTRMSFVAQNVRYWTYVYYKDLSRWNLMDEGYRDGTSVHKLCSIYDVHTGSMKCETHI